MIARSQALAWERTVSDAPPYESMPKDQNCTQRWAVLHIKEICPAQSLKG